jgi:TetR/AcrR family transcriptional regulator, transcriptional repressor for nem operon
MTQRAEQKAQTRQKIVDAAARHLVSDGLQGATIGEMLRDAGVTHGTFYTHFRSKEAMLAEAFLTAAAEASDRWVKGLDDLTADQGLALLLARNLGRTHLERPEIGCPFVAAGAEVWRNGGEVKAAYEAGVLAVARKVAGALGDDDIDRALVIHATCIGALTMARSVESETVALQIMRACRKFLLKSVVPNTETDAADAR